VGKIATVGTNTVGLEPHRVDLISSNTIIYCKRWQEVVRFYRDGLRLPVLSVADETRASVKSSGGTGVTISLQAEDIGAAWEHAREAGRGPTAIKDHPWQARVFHLFDPEGHRIEIWQRAEVRP
jgi:uncharacterized glyoxalase superfamily protein PhnB